MADIRVLQMPLFKRAYKKLRHNQQEATDQAVAAIVNDPTLGVQKRGDLSEVYVYKFDCVNQQFLLAYEWDPETRVLLALGVHENSVRQGLSRVG